jgi:hypothetical protein
VKILQLVVRTGIKNLELRDSKMAARGRKEKALIVKSWRDVGDTPCRQNHQEEAKF